MNMEAPDFQTIDKFVQDYTSLHPALQIYLWNAKFYCRFHKSTPLKPLKTNRILVI